MASSQENLFLASLSTGSRDHLVERSVLTPMPHKMSLYEADTLPKYAYFPLSGVNSVLTAMPDGQLAEVGMIGREGLVGSFHVLGPAPVPSRCMVQLPGEAFRIPLRDLRVAFQTSEEIRSRLLEFVQEQALSLGQIAGCHRLHEAEERLSRWLLMAHDRMQSDMLETTQEFLAEMLGARRTTVTLIAGELQRAGLIEYRRGRVRILDREGLESTACECYKIIRPLYANLYRGKPASF